MQSVPILDLKPQMAALKGKVQERINQILDHGRFIMGPEVIECEQQLAKFAQAEACLSAGSGTDAIMMGLLAIDIKPGDEVIVPDFSFFATAEIIALLGAKPVFCDIEADTYNMDVSKIEALITPRTRVIMPVSLYGQVGDMEEISALAKKHRLLVVEDAAQSYGATYNGKKSCALSDMAVTSFYPAKPLGCYGDGGALFINNLQFLEAAKQVRDHGQVGRYEHARLGFNGRFDSIQAAVILTKLERFAWELESRDRIAQAYTEAFKDLGENLIPPTIRKGRTCSWAQYTVRVKERDRFQATLKKKGIGTAIHYPKAMHEQKAFSDLGFEAECPEAVLAGQSVLSLPMFPDMTEEQLNTVIQAVKESYKEVYSENTATGAEASL